MTVPGIRGCFTAAQGRERRAPAFAKDLRQGYGPRRASSGKAGQRARGKQVIGIRYGSWCNKCDLANLHLLQTGKLNYLYISMPTVLLVNGYRFFFFSNERNEPMHIHIEKAEKYAKFWIDPLFVAVNYGFTSKELREISVLIETNEILIRERWNEHFSK